MVTQFLQQLPLARKPSCADLPRSDAFDAIRANDYYFYPSEIHFQP